MEDTYVDIDTVYMIFKCLGIDAEAKYHPNDNRGIVRLNTDGLTIWADGKQAFIGDKLEVIFRFGKDGKFIDWGVKRK